jgi:hypothetical protein
MKQPKPYLPGGPKDADPEMEARLIKRWLAQHRAEAINPHESSSSGGATLTQPNHGTHSYKRAFQGGRIR